MASVEVEFHLLALVQFRQNAIRAFVDLLALAPVAAFALTAFASGGPLMRCPKNT
jgi:hypothetical protein